MQTYQGYSSQVIVKRAFALSSEYGVLMDNFKHLLKAFHCLDGIVNDF
jgi:hypothetical protein